MITTKELVNYSNQLLNIELFKDYCPNGLQVQGKESIVNLISGVTASQALIDKAVEQKADAILVHHGLFWQGDDMRISGIKYQRLKKIFDNEINLLAYHLPLDAHERYGNNALFAKQLTLQQVETFGKQNLGLIGQVNSISGTSLAEKLAKILSRKALHIESQRSITRLALCTGAAQGFIEAAIEQGADAFISGEISENTVHIARENDIHYFAAGHHATERFGAKAFARHLADKFQLQHQFIDIDNPV